jgi:hypothetical protein
MKKLGIVCLVVLMSVALSHAANDLTTSNMRIDTFGSDVTIGTGRVVINSIVITAYSSAKTITFIDAAGSKLLVFECPSGYSINWTPPKSITWRNGFYFDDSASDLAASDFIFVFKE